MYKKFWTLIVITFLLFGTKGWTQNAYELKISIDGYKHDTLRLGYYLFDKQYVKDTVTRSSDGSFVFKGEEPLPGGMYLVLMAPDNKYFQILVSGKEQNFSLHTTYENPYEHMQFKNAPDNELFFKYLDFIGEKRKESKKIKEQRDKEGISKRKKEALSKKLDAIDEEVLKYQNSLVKNNPETLTAAIVKANMPLDYPEFSGTDKEKEIKRWWFTRKHVFDNIDMANPGILRTPFLYQRVNYYVQKLIPQHPDTINMAIDRVLKLMRPAEETFKAYLSNFLNEYSRSKIVGFDAVYVHLVNNYYAKGDAPWVKEDQLEKIVDNAKTLEPILIGKHAPNIVMQRRDGSKQALYDIKADYTILYFWKFDCGHCKHAAPKIVDFYKKYKGKASIEILSVCVKYTKDVPKCWEFVDEYHFDDFINVVDPYGRSHYQTIYDVKATPTIFVLDKDKNIISKRIGVEQLGEVIDHFLEQ